MATNYPIDFGDPRMQVFVGGLPFHITEEDFEEEVSTWGTIKKTYFRAGGGWGVVTFDSVANRNRFLKEKNRHVIGNKVVDVKAYEPKVKKPGECHVVIGKGGQVSTTRSTDSSTTASKPKPTNSLISTQMNSVDTTEAVSQTGAVLRYVSMTDGVIKTAKQNHIVFSGESVYLCKTHGFACRIANCEDFLNFEVWKKPSESLFSSLPVGTQVNFFVRKANFDETPEYKYQATLVWPQASKKPTQGIQLPPERLTELYLRFIVYSQNPGSAGATNTSVPPPTTTNPPRPVNIQQKMNVPPPPFPASYYNNSSGAAVAPRHQLAKLRSSSPSTSTTSSRGETASPRPSTTASKASSVLSDGGGSGGAGGNNGHKLNYDMPLDEILDDSLDELDADMEICLKITDFLKEELGSGAVSDNVPIYLTNNIKNLKSDDLVLDEILTFARTKKVALDDAKIRSIRANLKRLKRSIALLQTRDSSDEMSEEELSASAKISDQEKVIARPTKNNSNTIVKNSLSNTPISSASAFNPPAKSSSSGSVQEVDSAIVAASLPTASYSNNIERSITPDISGLPFVFNLPMALWSGNRKQNGFKAVLEAFFRTELDKIGKDIDTDLVWSTIWEPQISILGDVNQAMEWFHMKMPQDRKTEILNELRTAFMDRSEMVLHFTNKFASFVKNLGPDGFVAHMLSVSPYAGLDTLTDILFHLAFDVGEVKAVLETIRKTKAIITGINELNSFKNGGTVVDDSGMKKVWHSVYSSVLPDKSKCLDYLYDQFFNGFNLEKAQDLRGFFKCPEKIDSARIDGVKSVWNGSCKKYYPRLCDWLEHNVRYDGLNIKDTIDREDFIVHLYTVVQTWMGDGITMAAIESNLFDHDVPQALITWSLQAENTWNFDDKQTHYMDLTAIMPNIMAYFVTANSLSTPGHKFALGLPLASNELMLNQRGFVFHFYGENFGLLVTTTAFVLFEVNLAIIYDKNTRTWRRCRSKEDLPMGTYVKFHAKQQENGTILAFKVWTQLDLCTVEPTTYVTIPGPKDTYWKKVEARAANLSACIPALSNAKHTDFIVDRMVCCDKQRRAIDPNRNKEAYKSFNPFFNFVRKEKSRFKYHLEMKATVTALTGEGISYPALTNLAVAVDSLFKDGAKDHKNSPGLKGVLLDIFAISDFSIPNATQFIDLFVANFRKNWKAEASKSMEGTPLKRLEKLRSSYDVKNSLDVVGESIRQSGFYGGFFDRSSLPVASAPPSAVSSSVGSLDSRPSSLPLMGVESPAPIVLSQQPVDLSPIEARLSALETGINSAQIAAVDKNLEILNKEAKTSRAEIAKLNKVLEETVTPILDQLSLFTIEMQALKDDMTELKKTVAENAKKASTPESPVKNSDNAGDEDGVEVGPVVAAPASKKCYVRISTAKDGEVHEFPTDDEGNLSVSSISDVYPGIIALKFETESKSIRMCRKKGDSFEMPEDGWTERLYLVHAPAVAATPAAAAAAPGVPGAQVNPLAAFQGYPFAAFNLPGFPNGTSPTGGKQIFK